LSKLHAFVVATGAYGNIGDAIIRRQVVHWFDDTGDVEWHVYVGNAPEDWITQLRLPSVATIYRASDRWRWLHRLSFGRGRRALVLDPGEVPLAIRDLPSEIALLLVSIILTLRGEVMVRPPRGLGRTSRLGVSIHRASVRLSTLTYWRDPKSREIIGAGDLVPDTAFAIPSFPSNPWEDRDLLVVSYRGARAMPSPTAIRNLQDLARNLGLKVALVSQVEQDISRNAQLISHFDDDVRCDMAPWLGGNGPEQEDLLVATYRRAKVVVSDRLHVLIIASLAGAVPIEYVENPRPKISTTFSGIGVEGVSLDASDIGSHDLLNAVLVSIANRAELRSKLDAARTQLSVEIERIRLALERGRNP